MGNSKQKVKYILLLSHMRGYTTLLSHILGSNPEILGYAEKHQHYRNALDFLFMKWKAKVLSSSLYTPNFLFDKVLHNNYKVSRPVLNKENVIPLIMIRKPEESIKSIINMGQKLTKNIGWYREPEKVTNYYIKRLQKLEEYGQWADKKALFIPAEQVIQQTESTLQRISTFLNLELALSEEYDTFTFSGTRALGDPSEKIKEKKVIKKATGYSHINIDAALLETAERAYQNTCNSLKLHTSTL